MGLFSGLIKGAIAGKVIGKITGSDDKKKGKNVKKGRRR